MQKMVIEEPYEFIPPRRGMFWMRFCTPLLKPFLKLTYGIEGVRIVGGELLQASHAAGKGVLVTPNHPRISDPMTLGSLQTQLGVPTYTMASWHLFKQDGFAGAANRWMMPRLGAFSVHREGNDRASLSFAIDALVSGERPLVLFPEGVTSQANDHVGPLLEGTSVIARSAAKRRAKRVGEAGDEPEMAGVVVHPLAVRYEFLDDPVPAADRVLTRLETRLGWEPDRTRPIAARTRKLADGLLALREVEFTGDARPGDPACRAAELVDAVLRPIEDRLDLPHAGTAVTRVKAARTAILPRLLDPAATAAQKATLRNDLRGAFFAQQFHFLHPPEYLDAGPFGEPPPERVLETLARFDEDLNDAAECVGRWRVHLRFGEALPVGPVRPRGVADPLIATIRTRLRDLLEETAAEVRPEDPPADVTFRDPPGGDDSAPVRRARAARVSVGEVAEVAG